MSNYRVCCVYNIGRVLVLLGFDFRLFTGRGAAGVSRPLRFLLAAERLVLVDP